MLCEETRSEYIVIARAKGTKDSTILFRHCLKNVLPAYISLMAVSVAAYSWRYLFGRGSIWLSGNWYAYV